ncbi:MAG: sigma-70 family RNA polymerase sigma factor [Planctomycetota bacterium]
MAIAAGDRRLFAELLKRYQDRVVNLVYRLVGDWDAALDLGQEAFLRIYRRASSYRPEGNAKSWILAVAMNVARDYLRSRRRILYLDRIDVGDGFMSPGLNRGPATPPEILEREESRRRVRQVLQALPSSARTILLLRDFEGLSYEEMAEVLGCEMGTVKSRLHRGRRQFEELFRRWELGETEGSAE